MIVHHKLCFSLQGGECDCIPNIMHPVRENLLAFVQGKNMPYGKGPQEELVLYPGFIPEHADAVEGLLEMLERLHTPVVVTDRMQGTDCYMCENDIPHSHKVVNN